MPAHPPGRHRAHPHASSLTVAAADVALLFGTVTGASPVRLGVPPAAARRAARTMPALVLSTGVVAALASPAGADAPSPAAAGEAGARGVTASEPVEGAAASGLRTPALPWSRRVTDEEAARREARSTGESDGRGDGGADSTGSAARGDSDAQAGHPAPRRKVRPVTGSGADQGPDPAAQAAPAARVPISPSGPVSPIPEAHPAQPDRPAGNAAASSPASDPSAREGPPSGGAVAGEAARRRPDPQASRVPPRVGKPAQAINEAPRRSPRRSTVATDRVVTIAGGLTGIPYRWGGTTTAGFDCSGFTRHVYRKAGIQLPRTAAQQQRALRTVSSPRPGDLVFFGTPAHHVGIYAGGGRMYDAPRTGRTTGLHRIWSTKVTYGRPG